MNKNYSLYIFIAVCFFYLTGTSFNAYSQGQCLGGGCANAGSQYPGTTQSTTSIIFVTISTCMFGGEYAVCSVTSGITYEWSLCTADGGNASYDSQLTLRNNVGGALLCYSDDFCGDDAKIQWTATFTGTVRIRVNQYNCATNSTCTTLRWKANGGGSYNPCASIPVLSCGTSATANMSGGGAGWNITACGWSTPGQEMIYSFTPTTSGNHSINVTSASGGFVDYFWKLASGGCNNASWNCIQDVFSAGTYGAMNWTAGTTYYILLDPEGTGAYAHTFNINCPAAYNPCASIPVLSCGTSVTANMSGGGAGWNITACGFSTPGQEMIYSFTPTTSGTHSINVTTASGGFVDYFWKLASGGCNNASWNCIQDVFSAGTYGAMNWTAGTTYYILLDPEGTGAYAHTFNINCPGAYNPCASIPILSCATSVTANMLGGGAGWSITACGFSTLGQEMIYSFTPSISGTHNINVASATGGFVDYFWKLASNGCNNTGWNCIQDIFSTGTYGAMNWTAGVTYYILLDPEGTAATSHTFNVVCPTTGIVTAGDCQNAVNICTNASFQIDPSGFGNTNELCTSCLSNPGTNPASTNSGCLLSGETNSTWMVINIATSGSLQFSFGVDGGTNCYDWIMWPYNSTTCSQISSNTIAPVRCNWNGWCEGFTGIASPLPVGGDPSNFEPPLAVTAGQQFVICFSNYSSSSTSVPINFFGSAAVSCTPLPIELLSFTGHSKGMENILEWTTAAEINNDHFTIEKTTDGTEYFEIGKKSGNGNSNSLMNYSFIDSQPSPGINYYRLKQTDFDGIYSYSDVISIENKGVNATLQIYPNPFNGNLFVDINTEGSSEVTIEVYDLFGRLIIKQGDKARKGANTFPLNVATLAQGVYMLKVAVNGEENLTETNRIVKY